MAREKSESTKKGKLARLRNMYRLVVLNDETLEEKLSFRLSRLNVFVVLGSLAILLIFVTIYIIAFTPLREYIPGYSSGSDRGDIYDLQLRADSLEKAMNEKDLFIFNIKNIIAGKEPVDAIPIATDTTRNYQDITLGSSKEDSLLRAEMEGQDKVNLSSSEPSERPSQRASLSGYLFFTPLKGLVVNSYDPVNQHYGVDVVSKKNEAVKATLDGRVIMADWTLETGYTLSIQHSGNLISVYKHNASLLKKLGAYVKAGEPIAFVGESGELSTGPHLHFELWFNGNPVNPKDYIAF